MIFHHFWALVDLQRQRNYICKTVTKDKKKTSVIKTSRRNNSYEYNLKFNEKSIKVCKKMCLDTLDISETVVFTALKKLTSLGTASPERRGKEALHNAREAEKQFVRDHIYSFPRVESHYARKDSKREYLEGSLSLQKMYDLYNEERKLAGCESVSHSTYHLIFNHEFNISFHKRMKDRCDTCSAYEKNTPNDDEKEQYKKHIELKNESRQYKDNIKQNLQDNTSHAAAVSVFDMQEVLYSPNSDESSLYYKRKLNSYNLTVYDYRNKQGYCRIWPETEGNRGSNEVGSCVYRYLENLQKEGIKK